MGGKYAKGWIMAHLIHTHNIWQERFCKRGWRGKSKKPRCFFYPYVNGDWKNILNMKGKFFKSLATQMQYKMLLNVVILAKIFNYTKILMILSYFFKTE